MVTKYFSFLFIAVCFVLGCHPCKYCKSHNKMLARIDTTKAHKYWGKMCVSNTKDTLCEGDGGVACFDIFDGVTGRRIENGVIFFYGADTLRLPFEHGHGSYTAPKGTYLIVVKGDDAYSLKVAKKDVKIENNRIDFRCYLGRSLQF
jgi:hypothetical protein